MQLAFFLLQVAMENSFLYILPAFSMLYIIPQINTLTPGVCLFSLLFTIIFSNSGNIASLQNYSFSPSLHMPCFYLGTDTDLSSFNCLNICFTFLFEISDYIVICHMASILCFNATSNSCI